MLLRPLRALTWEYWARTRRLFLAALALGMVSTLTTYILWSYSPFDQRPSVEACLDRLRYVQLLYAICVLFAFSETNDLRISVPRHSLLLPVRIPFFVASRMALHCISIGALGFLNATFFYIFFGEARYEYFWFLVLWLHLFALVYFQTVAWCVGSAGLIVTALATALGLIGFALFGNWLDSSFIDMDDNPFLYQTTLLGGPGALCFSFSCFGVAMQRRGREFKMPSLLALLPRKTHRDLRVRPPFGSPQEAMRWYEYRRQGRVLPRLAFGFFALGLLYRMLEFPEGTARLRQYSTEMAMAFYGDVAFFSAYESLVVASFFSGGLFLLQNYRESSEPARQFLFVRPLPTKDLANARLASVLRAVAYASVPLLLVGCISYALDTRATEPVFFTPIIEKFPQVQGALLLSLAFLGVLAAIWTFSWFLNFFAIGLVFAFSFYALRFIYSIDELREKVFGSYDRDSILFSYPLQITAVWSLGVCIAVFIVAWRKKFVDVKRLACFVVALPVVGAGALTWLNIAYTQDGSSFDYGPLMDILPAVILLPLLPLATTPLTMHWARHR